MATRHRATIQPSEGGGEDRFAIRAGVSHAGALPWSGTRQRIEALAQAV